MLTPSDDKPDGNKRSFVSKQNKLRAHDPELFDALLKINQDINLRRVTHVETTGFIPNAVFFNDVLGDSGLERRSYFHRAKSALSSSALIFFDPDNGLDVASTKKGHIASSKYIYRDELEDFYGSGHSLLIYQHYPRIQRDIFRKQIAADLSGKLSGAHVSAFSTANVVFFLAAQPTHGESLLQINVPGIDRYQF